MTIVGAVPFEDSGGELVELVVYVTMSSSNSNRGRMPEKIRGGCGGVHRTA